MSSSDAKQAAFLQEVRNEIRHTIHGMPLLSGLDAQAQTIAGGKMLRAQLMYQLSTSTNIRISQVNIAAAALEMLHAASLLHDDVIDEGKLRRGKPALWVTHGAKAAVLAGDMLLSRAFTRIAESHPHAVPLMARTLQCMCQAEMEQESLSRQTSQSREDVIRIAQGKTGSLFGLCAYCSASKTSPLADALLVAGTHLGVAYQLADDLLDMQKDESMAGKSLGSDAATGKFTAADLLQQRSQAPQELIHPILNDAIQILAPWPDTQLAMHTYIDNTLQPILRTYFA